MTTMSRSSSNEHHRDTSEECNSSSLEQLCQVALHEPRAIQTNGSNHNVFDNGSNYVMVLSSSQVPTVVDTAHRTASSSQGNLLTSLQNQYGNLTFVNSLKAESVPGAIEGTIREINSNTHAELYTESFQVTDPILEYNRDQRSPTFPQQYRKTRDFTPDDLKDEGYWIKRRKNNEAAKRSREKRKTNDAALEARVAILEQMNEKLGEENEELKKCLAAANQKIKMLRNERDRQKYSNSPLESVNDMQTDGTTFNIDRPLKRNNASQNPPLFYIQNPQRAKYPSAVEQIDLSEPIATNHGVNRLKSGPRTTQYSEQISRSFAIEQSPSAGIIPSANPTIIKQSVNRASQASNQLSAATRAPRNSIIVPIHQLSSLGGSQVTAANQLNNGSLVQQTQNRNPIVYLNTGCGVMPFNTFLQTQPAVNQDVNSSANLKHHEIMFHPEDQAGLVNSSGELSDAALEEACKTMIIQQQDPDGSVVKTGTLVSMSTPIDHIIPLKKRKDDANSVSEDQSPGKFSQQPSSVGNPEMQNMHMTPVTTPAPSTTHLHIHRTGRNNAVNESPIDSGVENDSSSNPEYWRAQLITIMSEVERLKTQMGSITQQSSQQTPTQPVSSQSAQIFDSGQPQSNQVMTSSAPPAIQNATSHPQLVVMQPMGVRTSSMSNLETTPTKSPMMLNQIGSDARTDSPLTSNNSSTGEN